MRLRKIMLSYKSVDWANFAAEPFTVLFGQNNSGKTNILQALHGIFDHNAISGLRHEDEFGGYVHPEGAVWADLEPGLDFDDWVIAAVGGPSSVGESFRVEFTGLGPESVPAEWGDCDSFQAFTLARVGSARSVRAKEDLVAFLEGKPKAKRPMLRTLFLNWDFTQLNGRIDEAILDFLVGSDSAGGELTRGTTPAALPTLDVTWRWDPDMCAFLEKLTRLATDLLPDFVTVAIEAWVNYPMYWDERGKVELRCADGLPIESLGQGTTRWIATAVQMALQLIAERPAITTLREMSPGSFSGHVLLVDEPEAHLHPSAVASVVRWCHRMVDYGFTVVVASHHEEFLRAAGDDVALVHVTREDGESRARTLPSRRTSLLLDLAGDIGIHPANTLSLHSAVLFVEGPLDRAVLEELGGLELEAAGVKIIPIHGTKNLEGLVAAELVTELGMRVGVLTDATVPETSDVRPNSQLSSEERRVARVIGIAKEKGLPVPKSFGVPEADLLFALPVDAIRTYFAKGFPGWKELVAECRESEGKGKSDSVNWKVYARKHYGLHIDTESGVRDIVRTLDLEGVSLPSIRKAIDDVVNWAVDEVTEEAGERP